MENLFDKLLPSKNANEKRDLSLYGQFVGEWDYNWSAPQEDGSIKRHKGEWIFSYILEGNAVQDVFICPSRATREKDFDENAEYGTTVRVPMADGTGNWEIVYVCDLGRPIDRLVAKEVNGDIIQTGVNIDENDNTIWQWNFRNITRDTFHWEAIWSNDGQNWNICCELDAVRRK